MRQRKEGATRGPCGRSSAAGSAAAGLAIRGMTVDGGLAALLAKWDVWFPEVETE